MGRPTSAVGGGVTARVFGVRADQRSRVKPAVSKWWSKANTWLSFSRRITSKLTASTREKRWSAKRAIDRAPSGLQCME